MNKLLYFLYFLLFFGYLKFPFLKEIKLHYIIVPIIVGFSLVLLERLKLDKSILIFFLIIEATSFFSYIYYGIINYSEFYNTVIYIQILFIANILLLFIFLSYSLAFQLLVKILYYLAILYAFYLFLDVKNLFFDNKILIRYVGTFEDPNYFSLLILLFVSILLYKNKTEQRVFLRIINTIAITILFLCFVLIFSKGDTYQVFYLL